MINNLKMKKVSPHPLLFFNEISVLPKKKKKKIMRPKNHSRFIALVISIEVTESIS